MPSSADTSEAPYKSERDNQRPGEAKPKTTPHGAEDSTQTSKTRTDPNTGEPTGDRPEVGG